MNDNIIPGFDREKDGNLTILLGLVGDEGSVLVMSLAGYIDSKNTIFFQEQVNRVINAGYTKLILELGGLNYVSSTGIGAFTTILNKAKGVGGNIILVGIQPKVAEVFHLLGFSQSFAIVDSVDQGAAIFSGLDDGAHQGLFPAVLICPSCSKKQKILKAGRFRCIECKKILNINEDGNVQVE
jgi:anti-sigma B factor antagonist